MQLCIQKMMVDSNNIVYDKYITVSSDQKNIAVSVIHCLSGANNVVLSTANGSGFKIFHRPGCYWGFNLWVGMIYKIWGKVKY